MFGVRKRGAEENALEVKLVVGGEKVVRCFRSLHCRPATLDTRETEAKRADMKNTHKVVICRIGPHSG